MKKIKISELPLFQSLKGLFVMGTDVNNRSVKVNLEFIETKTTQAVSDAYTATAAASTASDLASEATKVAQTSAAAAQKAAENAQTAAAQASTAATTALNSSSLVDSSIKAADTATEAAMAATNKVLETLGIIIPTSLNVECVSRITLDNEQPIYIKAILSPDTAIKNILYISDGKAVEVGLDGRISALNKGISRIHVIPTCNTALAQSLLVEVVEPT